jgi:hypothetical protein
LPSIKRSVSPNKKDNGDKKPIIISKAPSGWRRGDSVDNLQNIKRPSS